MGGDGRRPEFVAGPTVGKAAGYEVKYLPQPLLSQNLDLIALYGLNGASVNRTGDDSTTPSTKSARAKINITVTARN